MNDYQKKTDNKLAVLAVVMTFIDNVFKIRLNALCAEIHFKAMEINEILKVQKN